MIIEIGCANSRAFILSSVAVISLQYVERMSMMLDVLTPIL